MTLEEWLRKGAAVLRTGPHPERARPDAEVLLRHLLKTERAALLARWKEKLDEAEKERFAALIERRRIGEPVQYITGEAEFYGMPFRVTPDVLIPRPETEHLVEKAIELASGFAEPRIVDVGTGSGAIAVSLARALPHGHITAIDVSAGALEIAKENAKRNDVAGRIRFLHGDLLAPVSGERFDIVASNPPYVADGDRASLAVEVRDHEPASALFAGEDGLSIYRRLIPAAWNALAPGGFIALEIGYGQVASLRILLAAREFRTIEFVPDLQHIPRVAVARRS